MATVFDNETKSDEDNQRHNLNNMLTKQMNVKRIGRNQMSQVTDTMWDEKTQTTKKIIIKTIKRNKSRKPRHNQENAQSMILETKQ